MTDIAAPAYTNDRPTAPANPNNFIPRFGMYAGPGYAAGRAWNSTATVNATAWEVAPVSYLDAVTKNHDINYTYIEKTYMQAGADGVLRPKAGLSLARVKAVSFEYLIEEPSCPVAHAID